MKAIRMVAMVNLAGDSTRRMRLPAAPSWWTPFFGVRQEHRLPDRSRKLGGNTRTDLAATDPVIPEDSRPIAGNPPEAFAALMRPHLSLFTAGIYRILQNAQDTQAALQAAFITIHRESRHFTETRKFLVWAYQACLSEALRLRRQRARRLEDGIVEFVPKTCDAEGLTTQRHSWAFKRAFGPLTEPEAERLEMTIRESLSRLSDDQRVVFILRDLEGMDTEEVARKLGIARALVRQRLHQARLCLRDIVAGSDMGEAMA